MRTAGRFLFGFRTDIDLNQRWWHRLLKVVFSLGVIGLYGIVVVAIRQDEPANKDNVDIVEDLQAYNTKHPELRSTLSSFQGLGNVGRVDPSGEISSFYISPYELFCSGNMAASTREFRDFIRTVDSDYNYTEDQAEAFIKERKMDDGKPYCLGRTNANFPDQKDIVIYEMNQAATVRSWAKSAGVSTLAMGVLSLLVLNLYYRGMVYIICGPRKKSVPEAASII